MDIPRIRQKTIDTILAVISAAAAVFGLVIDWVKEPPKAEPHRPTQTQGINPADPNFLIQLQMHNNYPKSEFERVLQILKEFEPAARIAVYEDYAPTGSFGTKEFLGYSFVSDQAKRLETRYPFLFETRTGMDIYLDQLSKSRTNFAMDSSSYRSLDPVGIAAQRFMESYARHFRQNLGLSADKDTRFVTPKTLHSFSSNLLITKLKSHRSTDNDSPMYEYQLHPADNDKPNRPVRTFSRYVGVSEVQQAITAIDQFQAGLDLMQATFAQVKPYD